MSFYPQPKNFTSGIYNPSSFIGIDDIGSTTKLTLDLGNYVRSDAAKFTNNVEIDSGKNLVINNETQSLAFTDSKNSDLVNTKNKTTDIAYSNNQTTIGGDLQVSGDLLINDNNLQISKISGLQNKLNEIDTNFTNIGSNDADILVLNNFKTSQEIYNSSNDTNILNINSLNTTQNTRLDSLEVFETSQGLYNTNNDSKNTAQDDRLNIIESFNALQVTQNEVVNALDLTQNGRLDTIEAYNVTNSINITNLQDKDTSQDAVINGILTSINDLEIADGVLQTNITNNDNDITTLNGSVSGLNTLTSQHTSSISDLETLTSGHTTSINTLNTLTSGHTNSINDLETLTTSHTNSISQNTSDIAQNSSDILLKQNIINSSNRLNSSYIGDGSVSNLAFQTLAGINTSSSIESRLTTLSNTISNLDIDVTTLENLQNIDLTSFDTIGTQITALQEYDTANDLTITGIQTDVSNLQTGVASNTGRLNVKDSEISTINTTLTTQATNIATNVTDISQNTSDIANLESQMASAQADILTKQDEITALSKLDSSLVSTNVNLSPDTLDNVLQSLRDVNDSQSTSISNINSSITTLTNSIASNDTEILALQNQDVTHSNQISTINSSITSINNTLTTKQDEIDVNNKLDSSLVYDSNELDTLDNIVVRIDNDIATKQDIINNTDNKLPIDNIDLTGSNLVYADYGSSINSKFTALDGQISTLTTLQNGDIANFTAIDDNFTVIEGNITNLQNAITKVPYLDNVTSDVQNQIDGLISSNLPSLTYDSPSTTTTISNNTKVTKIIFNNDLSEQTTAFTSTKDTQLNTNTTDISTLQGEMTTAQGNITSINNTLTTKQSILNGTDNKLNPSFIDSGTGTMTAQKMEYLSSISEDINTKLTNIDTVLTNQATLNTSVSNDISSLTSNKQDVLNNTTNFLNPEYIETSGAGVLTSTKMQYLSSITSDLQTQLDSKISSVSNEFDDIIVDRVVEKIEAATISFSSNILTVDTAAGNPAILYFDDLTSNTNFQLNMTNLPAGAFKSYTYTLWIECNTYQAYCNAVNVNGTLKTITFPDGSPDISSADSNSVIMQQITVLYLLSASNPDKVISNVTVYKAQV